MNFLFKDETRSIEKKLRSNLSAQPKAILYFPDDHNKFSDAAQQIAAAFGNFSEATMIFTFALSGDGWGTHEFDNTQWRAFRDWRESLGEHRRLYDAPGHTAMLDDTDELRRLIEFAFVLGWDAILISKPGRHVMQMSHDERLELYSGSGTSGLAGDLQELGFYLAPE